MNLRIAKFLVLIAALQILGGPWAVLRTVAWTGMLIDFARYETLTVAVEKTFDGQHPCQLCVAIEGAEKNQTQQDSSMPTLQELKGVLNPVSQVFVPRSAFVDWPQWVVESVAALSFSPPVPPPRVA